MDYIPYDAVYLFIGIDVALLIYALIDNRNPYYGNIIASFLATIIGAYLSLSFTNGKIMAMYGSSWFSWESGGMAIFFIIMTLYAAFYTLLQIVLVFMEKTGRLDNNNNSDDEDERGA